MGKRLPQGRALGLRNDGTIDLRPMDAEKEAEKPLRLTGALAPMLFRNHSQWLAFCQLHIAEQSVLRYMKKL